MRRQATLGLLTSLYFAQGVPYGFFTQALPVLLREQKLSLPLIGLAHLLSLPWALKFLWAPLVDGVRASARLACGSSSWASRPTAGARSSATACGSAVRCQRRVHASW